ncbi:hypothetical protein C6501_18535 [Candidatus Poribacteria bacterium]|nr:MAG: hypothetical protein C6501_18535 [Candidatus Poribacteria bacterium]
MIAKRATDVPGIISFRDLKWSPDGKYLVYTGKDGDKIHHVVIPFDKRTAILGKPIEILKKIRGKTVHSFAWINPEAYSVQPAERLTTLWGKLKKTPTRQGTHY